MMSPDFEYDVTRFRYYSPAVPLPKGYEFHGDMELVENALVLKCIPLDDEKPIVRKRVALDDLRRK